MNKVTYKNQDITSYLLGALPDAETEYFDELSFTDDDFADELKAAENDLIDAYINSELKGADLEKFNSYYLVSPLRREKVEFAKGFQAFAGKNIAESNQEIIVESKSKSFFVGLFSIFTKPRPVLQWGFALATLALMFFGGWVLWENSRLNSEIGKIQSNSNKSEQPETDLNDSENQLSDQPANQQNVNSAPEKELANNRQEREKSEPNLNKKTPKQPQIAEQQTPKPKVSPLPNRQPSEKVIAQAKNTPKPDGMGTGYASPAKIVSFVLLPPLRGGNKLPTFSIPSDTYSVEAKLQLESDDYPFYQVTLQSDSQTIWQSRKLRAAAKGKNKVLSVSFPANLLKSQVYSLQVSGIKPDGSTEIISDYAFKSVR